MANETITGKIFTLKDSTGTYNRFPRTVMEAVYGLNTYLQNQFSSLADIYMPIEGITESKPLQEFVYRACPSSIKAKSVSLDRIYGKTLAWNQLGRTSASSGTHYGLTVVANADGSFSLSGTAQEDAYFDFYDSRDAGNIISSHKYYIGCGLSGGSNETYCIYDRGTYGYFSDGRGVIFTGTGSIFVPALRVYAGVSVDFNVYPQLIDLTLLYGSAIDGMTDAQILAKFESEFPGYHSYSAGKLISNDAESIETVGFNRWDEEWEVGSYYLGEKVAGQNNTIRCKNKIAIFPGETYFYKCQEYTEIIEYFDSTGAYIGRERTSSNSLFTAPSNAYYMVFVVSSDYGTTYNHDICINLSDPAKNGTYEPYRKSTMQLNLGSFQGRDSQGNVTTITGGLKSAGSVKDEIVGNKYIKRVGSVDLGSLEWSLNETYGFVATPSPTPKAEFSAICSKYIFKGSYIYVVEKSCGFIFNTGFLVKDSTYNNAAEFKTAMSGVYLYYELATPIEYELVSPLVPTVKAGTTEARISPNADGLSAPMVADMTYSAGQSEDATQAQYATVAGRLYNSHKLWGQDFDGTQDVSGALTGVTSITMNGALSGVTTLSASGAVTLGSTLSVAGNTTVGGTLTVTGLTSIAGGVKLTTTKKIWFDDTHYIELLNGHLHTNLPIVSDSYITAGAANTNA